ncbi:helicase associated domain-containing protein [[Kitasatospora] papulosa]|uniref:helicase associated domain-containing protein n=1 Tax=[Kitasatospora] papulosa TaxID=1464011 RepID=UPI0036A12DC1
MLEAVDEHWNPPWPAAWQRHYAAVREMLAEESVLAYIEPGATVHGMDIGRWLAKQHQPTVWSGLMDGQRELLEAIGITPLPDDEAPAKPPKSAVGAFERGIAALTQYKAPTGSVAVPRTQVERLEDGTEVKLGVFLSNSKSRLPATAAPLASPPPDPGNPQPLQPAWRPATRRLRPWRPPPITPPRSEAVVLGGVLHLLIARLARSQFP